MSKISEYGNYDTGKSPSEVETFKETGVLPVSGKYADNGNMTTKNVKLSDLVGGGGGDAESLAGHGLYASNDKLTVDTDDTLTIVEVGYLSEARYKVSVMNPVPSTTDASDGDVLTYDATSDDIVWSAPSGGGGSDPFAGMTSWKSTFNQATLTEYFADPDNPTHLDACELEVNVKADGGIVKHQYLLHAGSASFEGPWAS